MRIYGLALSLGCLLLAGCSGGDKTASGGNTETTGTTGTVTPAPKPPPKVDKDEITDVTVGKGDLSAADGDTVWVLYRGTLASNGKEFDSNMSPDKDVYSFTIGQGAVIKGWDEGLIGMKIGGERKLRIPPALAYGSNEQDKIPANSVLDFDIKLLGLMKAGQDRVIDCVDKKVGTGPEVKEGDKVTIHYVVRLLNGRVFDDSHTKGPYKFQVGAGQTLSCIEEGVTGMKVGGVREVTAPPATAYIGRPARLIPPNSEVKVTIELQSINK